LACSSGTPEPTRAPIIPPVMPPAPAPANPAARGPAITIPRPGIKMLVHMAAITPATAPITPPTAAPLPASAAAFVPISVSSPF